MDEKLFYKKAKTTRETAVFLHAEVNAIDKSKYIESEKAHRDLYFDQQGRKSNEFYTWWISNHAEEFRVAWKSSICRKCALAYDCKDCLKDKCDKFLLDPVERTCFFRFVKICLYQMIFWLG